MGGRVTLLSALLLSFLRAPPLERGYEASFWGWGGVVLWGVACYDHGVLRVVLHAMPLREEITPQDVEQAYGIPQPTWNGTW